MKKGVYMMREARRRPPRSHRITTQQSQQHLCSDKDICRFSVPRPRPGFPDHLISEALPVAQAVVARAEVRAAAMAVAQPTTSALF